MLKWKPLSGEHSAIAETAFAKLIVDVDMPNTRKADVLRYDARVEANATALCVCDDLPSMDEAKDWCESQYAELLFRELTALDRSFI